MWLPDFRRIEKSKVKDLLPSGTGGSAGPPSVGQ